MRLPMQKLFEKYQGNLYAAAFNVCKNAEDAEDVVQDTFIQYYLIKKKNLKAKSIYAHGCCG